MAAAGVQWQLNGSIALKSGVAFVEKPKAGKSNAGTQSQHNVRPTKMTAMKLSGEESIHIPATVEL